ncbi:MAG: 30S ribosome-binding factor RbfA [Planctomycetota bacterium]
MPHRTEKLGHAIRAVLAEAIQTRLSDPRIELLTSITHVEVSADLSLARVYVSVMAPEVRRKLCLQALHGASGRLRRALGERLVMRIVPRLEFVLDDSIQRAFNTVQAIDEAMAELGERPPWVADEDDWPDDTSANHENDVELRGDKTELVSDLRDDIGPQEEC